MSPKNLQVWVLSLILLSFPACKSKDMGVRQQGAVLATVNGVAITEDDIYLRLEGAHGRGNITPEMRAQALEDFVNQELLYQKGVELGLDRDVKYRNAVIIMEKRLEAFKRGEMARRVSSTQIAATVNVTNEDAEKYYKENVENLKTEFHLAMVRFSDEAQAEHALNRIKKGTSFESIAREKYSSLMMGQKAPWDLGFLQWHQIPSEWRETVPRLKRGEVSGALKGRGAGITLIKLVEKRKNPRADFEHLRTGIMNRLRDEKIMEAYDRYIQKLKGEAKVVRFTERRESVEKP